MVFRLRLAARLLLLVLAVLTFAGAGVCSDSCGVACGDCTVCAVAACLTGGAAIGPAAEFEVLDSLATARPDELAVRAIEHVPLFGC